MSDPAAPTVAIDPLPALTVATPIAIDASHAVTLETHAVVVDISALIDARLLTNPVLLATQTLDIVPITFGARLLPPDPILFTTEALDIVPIAPGARLLGTGRTGEQRRGERTH